MSITNKAKVEKTSDGCRFDEVGYVEDNGCIYGISLIPAMGLKAVVKSNGCVYDADSRGESEASCWVDAEGRIYDRPYNSRTEPVAHVLPSGMVYRHPHRNDSLYLAGRVEIKEGITLRQAAGAAAYLLLGFTDPALPKDKEESGGDLSSGKTESDDGSTGTEDDKKGTRIPTEAGEVLFGIIGIVGAAFLFNYIFGLLFDYHETVRQSIDTLTKTAYALNATAVIAAAGYCIKTFIHRNYDVPLKIFIQILIVSGILSFFWIAFWVFIPDVLFGGDVPETFLGICGFITIALVMLSMFMEEGNKNVKPRNKANQR